MKKPAFILIGLLCFSALTATDIYAQVLAEGEPSVLKEDKAQSNYVYDLKVLIQKSRQNIRSVNDKIKEQAIQKRNQQREEKAREYFLQAQKLAEEGDLQQSRELYEKAIRITEHPEMKYYIKESERRAKVQEAALAREETDQVRRSDDEERAAVEKVENMYQGAVSLYKQQRFKDAKAEFQTVDEIAPDYKAVRSYLQIIEQDIIQSEQQQIKDQRKEIERQEKEVDVARLREKELWRKEIDQKEVARKKQLEKQAQEVYDDAVKLYQDRKYMAAKEKFQEVEWVIPEFKSTRSYLQRIDNDVLKDRSRVTEERQKTLEKQRWEETLAEKRTEEEKQKIAKLREREALEQKKDEAEFVYQAALALFNKDQYAQAREKFDEVERLYPEYKSTRDYLKKIVDMMSTAEEREKLKAKSETEQKLWEEQAARKRQDQENFKKAAEEADTLFTDGLELYKMGRLIEAKEKFLAADGRVPDYKSTRSYLKKIDDDISAILLNQRKESGLAAQRDDLLRLKAQRDKADQSYNEAIIAYDSKDYALAKARLQETEATFPNYKKTAAYLSRIDDDIRHKAEDDARQAREASAEGVYAQAIGLYSGDQFDEAKAKFVEVATLIPDYKQTSFYLERIDDDIIRKKERDLQQVRDRQAEVLYNQAVAFYKSEEFEQAKAKFMDLELISSGYKDTLTYLGNIDLDIQRKVISTAQKTKADQAEMVYTQAVSLYQAGDFSGAKEKFIHVEVIYPDYKDTPKYLAMIDGDIQRKARDLETKRKADEAEPLYTQALDLYKAQQFADAKKKLIQVQLTYPAYKDTVRYLSRVDSDIQSMEARLSKEERLRKADALYTEAVALYGQQKFEDAKKKFLETSSVSPDYRGLKGYLARIDGDIKAHRERLAQLLKDDQAEIPYAEAVELYLNRGFEAARYKFLEVVKIQPDYKKTKSYLSRIDEDIRQKKKDDLKVRTDNAERLYQEASALMTASDMPKAYQKFMEVDAGYPDFKATRKYLVQIRKELAAKGIALPDPGFLSPAPVVIRARPAAVSHDDVLEVYKEAVGLYKKNNFVQARVKFEEVQKLWPNYRSTAKYLEVIKNTIGEAVPAPVAVPPAVSAPASAPAPVPVIPLSLAVAPNRKPFDTRSTQEISRRSGDIYRQIQALANDKDMTGSKQSFARIDRILADLETEKRKLAETIARQENKGPVAVARQQKVDLNEAHAEDNAAARRQALKEKAAVKEKEAAEVSQLKLAMEQEDLKKKERARISQVRDLEKETRLKAEVLYQQALSALKSKDPVTAHDRFVEAGKVFPGYKDIDQQLLFIQKAEAEKKLLADEGEDRTRIARVAEKANAVNQEATALSQNGDITGVRQKFDELEGLLKELQVLKGHMLSRRDDYRVTWEKKASEAREKMLAKKPIKDMKAMVEGRTAREQAMKLYREGQQFYSDGQYAEAKVKFRDAFNVDPTLKAAYSYLQRIDRILDKKDYEEQVSSQKSEKRDRERVAEAKEGQAPAVTTGPDAVRAAEVQEEGVSLYKAARYKEARIKFEELQKVGDDRQKDKARRYLNLIETAIANQQVKADQDRRASEAKYLEAKRAEARMGWEKSRAPAAIPVKVREPGIEQKVQLRAIEHNNAVEREKMLGEKDHQDAVAGSKEKAQASRQKKVVAREKGRLEEVPLKAGMPDALVVPSVPGPAAAVPTDITSEQGARVVLGASGRTPAKSTAPRAIDRSEAARFNRLVARQKSQDAAEENRKRQIMARQKKTMELEKMRLEERKRRQEEALITRNRSVVTASLSGADTIQPAVRADIKPAGAGIPPVVEKNIVQTAVDEEKRRLAEQHAAIQRDFNAGVERVYGEALELYKNKMYDEARADLIQVNDLIKGYKKTEQYLKMIDKERAKAAAAAPVVPVVPPESSPDIHHKAVTDILDRLETTPAR